VTRAPYKAGLGPAKGQAQTQGVEKKWGLHPWSMFLLKNLK